MTYRLITAPALLPVTLAEARDQLRVTATGSPPTHRDDALIERLIRAQVEYVDGAFGILNRCLITQAWRLTLDTFPSAEIEILLPPLQTVTQITYFDAAGDAQIMPALDYSVDPAGWIVLPGDNGWPDTGDDINQVAVDFTAGYGDDPEDVPQAIRAAILLRVEALYDRDPNSQKTLVERADDLLENFKAGGGGIG